MHEYVLFVYICMTVGDPLINGRAWITLTGLILPHFCPCPKNLELNFHLHKSWSSLLSVL